MGIDGEIADAVTECLHDGDYIVLGSHGTLSVGSTLEAAYSTTLVTEESARI